MKHAFLHVYKQRTSEHVPMSIYETSRVQVLMSIYETYIYIHTCIHIYIYKYIYAANIGTCANENIYKQSVRINETSHVHVKMNAYETYTYMYVNVFSERRNIHEWVYIQLVNEYI